MDDDGYATIVDRKKDMILTAGFNVYPAEIERVLCMHPAVALAAVGSVPDEAKGELAKALRDAQAGCARCRAPHWSLIAASTWPPTRCPAGSSLSIRSR